MSGSFMLSLYDYLVKLALLQDHCHWEVPVVIAMLGADTDAAI